LQEETEAEVIDDEAKSASQLPKSCIIDPNWKLKILWDFYIMIVMVIAAFLTPWQLAFVDDDTEGWLAVNAATDLSFLIDLMVTFFTAFYEEKTYLLVTDKRVIARKYLRFWFWMDLISIVPIDLIVRSSSDGESIGSLAKFTRVGKLYKMVRMLRMVKMIRIVKDRKKIMANLDSMMKTNPGFERLIFFCFGFALLVHTFASVWIMLASFDDEMNWRIAFRNKYFQPSMGESIVDDYGDGDWYVVAIYFVATTVNTVGYGDLGPQNNIERFFCILLMFFGVIAFSFTTGSMGSIIASSDSAHAKLQEKLDLLKKIKMKYALSE